MIDRGERRIVSNTLAQAVAPAMRAILGVILTVAITRYLGLTKFGAYALAFAYVGLMTGIFANWGLSTVALREMSKHPEEAEAYITSATALQLVISAITYVLIVVGTLFLHHTTAETYAIMLYGLTVFLTPLDILTLKFQAELRLHRTMPPTVVGVLLNFLFTVAAILLHGPLVSLIIAALAALLIQWAWVLRLALPLPLIRLRPLYAHWAMFARESWPIGFGTTIGGFMQQAPAVCLSFLSLEAVGAFSAANRIPQILALIPVMVNTSAFPLLSHLAHHNRPGFRVLVDHLLGTIVLVSVPVAIFMYGSATTITHFIFPHEFLVAVTPVQYLGLSLGVGMPALIIGEAMITAGKQRLNLLVQVMCFALMILLLSILIPSQKATGAAMAIFGCNALMLAAQFGLGRLSLGRDLPWQPLAAGLAGAVAGALVLTVAHPLGADRSTVLAAAVAGLVIAALEWHTTLRILELLSAQFTHRGTADRRREGDRRRTPRTRLIDPPATEGDDARPDRRASMSNFRATILSRFRDAKHAAS